ncbi:MAG TPA: hypothetical protein VGW12_21420 [Pyrinomonadaceae bacterium]|nr:hypothetical protein [Pyrinomonadaceae bacterium]
MARFKDPNVPAAAFQPYLEPGEQLSHVAYGVKQPNVLLIALTGGLITALLTKEYVIGMTDRRLIVLHFKGKDIRVQEVLDYRLNSGQRPPVKTSTGSVFTHIKVDDPAKPFVAKFHRMGMPGNREGAMAIAAALTGQPSAA